MSATCHKLFLGAGNPLPKFDSARNSHALKSPTPARHEPHRSGKHGLQGRRAEFIS